MNFFIRFDGDPCENRTRVTAVKGPCLNLLTNGPLRALQTQRLLGLKLVPATICFPGQSPAKYHRR